jgi:spore coat polysaccharide biosynthesis protein SpsF
MTDRRFVGGLACRLGGTRLWAKPLQRLAPDVSILGQIVGVMKTVPVIEETVIAIADEPENRWLGGLADDLGCAHSFGDETDVLGRLIAAGESVGATDLVRKTTESPFFELTGFDEALRRHVEEGNDVTVVDPVPLGTAVEIYTMDALRRSHEEGRPEDRSEFVSNYVRFNQARFRVGIVEPPAACRRPDVRLTVDYPEDLILCRAVYERFAEQAPRIPLEAVIEFLDQHPDLTALVSRWTDPTPIWTGAAQRA